MGNISLDDLKELTGKRVGVSQWLTIDQDQIDDFARLTGDNQYIHVDPQRAEHSPFGSTIAHGFLTLSLLPAMIEQAIPHFRNIEMRVNYGFNHLRFVSPVHVGSQVRGCFDLRSVAPHGTDQTTVIWDVIVEVRGEPKPAVVAQWVHRFYTKP